MKPLNPQETDVSENNALMRPYDLVGGRSRETHYYIIIAVVVTVVWGAKNITRGRELERIIAA
jgi:hypothetical protein